MKRPILDVARIVGGGGGRGMRSRRKRRKRVGWSDELSTEYVGDDAAVMVYNVVPSHAVACGKSRRAAISTLWVATVGGVHRAP